MTTGRDASTSERVEHSHKAVTVDGVVKVLRGMGVLEQIVARASAESRRVLEDPHCARLHPGSVMDEAFTILSSLLGTEAVAQVMYRATQASLAGIAGPLGRLFMTMMGGGPGPLLQRFDTLASSGTSGFKATWYPTGDHAGRMHITAAEVTPPVAEFAWQGTLQYLLVFASVEGRVTPLPREDGGLTLVLEVAWTPR